MRAPGELYAIIRTAKLKSSVAGSEMSGKHGTPPQCIDDAADHELRLKPIPNADPSKLSSNRLLIFVDGRCEDLDFEEAKHRGLLRHDLFRSLVVDRLASAGIPIQAVRSDQVLAQQVMVSASHEFFLSTKASDPELPVAGLSIDDRYVRWRRDSVDFLRKRFGDRVVAIVEHLDELTPHLTAVVVPLVEKAVKAPGRASKGKPAAPIAWRLSAFDVFNKKTLDHLWTEYGDAMKGHGLRRPPHRSMVTSTDVKEFYTAVADAAGTAEKLEKTLAFSLPPVEGRVFAESATKYRDRAGLAVEQWRQEIAELLRTLHCQAKAVEHLRKRETELRRALREADERRSVEEQKHLELQRQHDAMRVMTTDIVAARVLETLEIPLVVENPQILRADLADGRVVRTSSKGFSITGPSPKDCVAGRGAVELLMALFRSTATDAFKLCVACFGEAGIGAIHAWTHRRFAGRISQEDIHLLATRLKPHKAKAATDRISPGQQDVPEDRQLKQPGEDVDR
ncbi:MAG: Plasmid recombination enzyme [Betaproteobacteria bacterium ADurb.Bin341]|nr:MAG: Plasmid recombination enzyme [Betaproteobacteria bacterium ADurb.Bin341]